MGVDDSYEPPNNAEIIIDTSQGTPEEAVKKILVYLYSQEYLSKNGEP